MSGRKFCRLCLNEVVNVSSSIYSSNVEIRQLLINIFPGMDKSLTRSLRLCEECFKNVSITNEIRNSIMEKEKKFFISNYGSNSTRPYCGLCFRFETSDMIFLHKDTRNYSSEVLKGIIEIALPEFKIMSSYTNICSFCWSWIKKIYSFKKRCFKVEETLKEFCFRNKLPTITDELLEEFLYEQNCVKTRKILPPKPIILKAKNISDIITHKDYFQCTGQIFPNLSEDKRKENDDNLENHKCDRLEENDLKEVEVEYEDKILTSREDSNIISNKQQCNTTIENIGNSNQIDTLETEIDADDEFDETIERKIEGSENFVIISDDDENNECYTSPNTPTEEIFTDKTSDVCIVNDKIEEDIEIVKNEINNVEDILPRHYIFNKKNNELGSCKNILTQPNNNNNLEKEFYPVPLAGCTNKIHDNSGKDKKGKLEIVYCGTHEFSKIYQSTTEPDCQIIEDNTNCLKFLLENAEIDILPVQDTRNSTHGNSSSITSENIDITKSNVENNQDILSSTFDLFQSCFNAKTSYIPDNDECVIVNEGENTIEQENVSDSDLFLVDEDCFEVVNERSNIIDITNVDSYVEEAQAMDQRNTYADCQKNELWGCYICVAKFSSKSNVRKHMLSHEHPWNKYGRFQCRKCPFKANSKGGLTRHQEMHSRASFRKFFGRKIIYICPYCSNMYNAKEDTQAHINEHVISWKNFQCGECMFTTNKSETLKMHYRKYHCTGKDPTFSR